MSGAAEPGEADDLSDIDAKRDGTDMPYAEPAHLDRRLGFGVPSPDDARRRRPADDVVDELLGGDVGRPVGGDGAAVAKHGHRVGDAEHLVEAVGDVDDADIALARSRPRTPKRRPTSASGRLAVGSSRTSSSHAW